MTNLGKNVYALCLAFLPYLLAANVGLLVGWQCLDESHICGSVHSWSHWEYASGSHDHHQNHVMSGPEGVKRVAHCCACSGIPTVQESLAEHSLSRTGWSDSAPTLNHESMYRGYSFTMPSSPARFYYPSLSSLDSPLATLRAVILLI